MNNNKPASGPISSAERITSLDIIRGIAILGILPMNVLVFGLDKASYHNASVDGISQTFDWVVAILTTVFIDQKMMALFSLLFGVGHFDKSNGSFLTFICQVRTKPGDI